MPQQINVSIFMLNSLLSTITSMVMLWQRFTEFKNRTIGNLLLGVAGLCLLGWVYLLFLFIFDIDLRTYFSDGSYFLWLLVFALLVIELVAFIRQRKVTAEIAAERARHKSQLDRGDSISEMPESLPMFRPPHTSKDEHEAALHVLARPSHYPRVAGKYSTYRLQLSVAPLCTH